MKELPSIDELNATAPQRDALVRTDGGGAELPSLAELNGETEGERGGEGAPTPLPSLAELNGELPTLAELNGKTGEKAQKKDLGIWETMKTEKEAQLGKKMGDLEAAARYLLPVAGKALDAEEMRKASVEERLATGDFRDSLEATKLALTIGVPQEELRKINDETRDDDAAMRERFAGLTKERYAQRLATRMEAGQKLEGNELGWWEKVGKGLLGGAATVAEFANPVTMALGTGGKIIERGAQLEEQGETREKTWLKAIAGGVAEQQIWASPVVEKMIKTVGGPIVRAAEQALGLSGRKWIAGAAEAVTKKLGESESGRLLMKTAEVLGKVDEKTHFGSLPKMIMKTRLTEFADEVVGLNYVGEDTVGKRFGDWFEKCISIEDNVELLTGIIGIHAVMAGASAVKARRMEKAFREGRTDLVGEYIGYDQAKKLSNEDLGNIYKLITSPNLTAEKVETFLNGIADAKNAKLTAAAKKIGETLEERRTVTPEMEAALDAKVAEYAEGNEAVAAKIKGDIVDRLQDNRGLTDPDILEEMVAQSARRFNPEARRMKAHDLRGETDVGKQMTGIEEMGVTGWEQAEAEGLTQKDKLGRYTGGARQALNISIHGTEKLKASVRDGKISGDLAEDLLTTAQCELGARPKEEQTRLIDEILDAAGGDEALARRILAKIEEREGTASVLQQEGEGFVERLAEEAKAESIRERNPGISEEEARGAAVEPVETEDGKITTVGSVVGAEPTEIRTTEPKPQTALEGVENAERLKGTKLRVTDNGIMSCNTFPELRVQVSAEGIVVEGLTDWTMAKPENMADAAAVMAQLSRIAKRNGITVRFPTEEATKVATAIANEVEQQGLAKAQAKLDTRAKLFGILFKTTLGTGVTYDEASFKEALGKVENGRQFVDNHGNIYGFVDGEGKLHFNPTTLNFNTPIHEYGHLALEAVKGINNTLWKRGMELIRESDYYREIEEASKIEGHEYGYLKDKADAIADEALATMIGDRGERLVTERGLDGALKAWLKEVWKAFKGALGVADLSEEQIEKMTLGEFVDTINAELLRGSEFGVRRRPSGLSRREAARARARREEGKRYEELEAREAAEAERMWQQSGMGIIDYVRSRAEEGDPEFDLDWEYMREIARDREAGRFQARRLVNGQETAVSVGYPLTLREARDPNKVLGILSPLVGKSVAQIGQMNLTRITDKSVEHLMNSAHARSDRRMGKKSGKKLWRGTVAGMSVTGDIIGTSELGSEQDARHVNAPWKKETKFYRADTRFAVELENGQYEIYPCKLIVSEKNGERQVYDITEIGEPTLTASSTLANANLVPGVNATTGAPGSAYTGESAHPTRGIIPNGGDGGNGATSRFSVKRPVERTKDLIAVHNVDLKGIRKVSDMGGFAMPSIAVTKDKIGHKEFGNCTVLFSPSSIDPKTNRQNALYSHDAWTPSFPKLEPHIDMKAAYAFRNTIRNLVDKAGVGDVVRSWYYFDDVDGIERMHDRADSLAKAYAYDTAAKAAYLVSQGRPVERVMAPADYSDKMPYKLYFLTNDQIAALGERFGGRIFDQEGYLTGEFDEKLAKEIHDWTKPYRKDGKPVRELDHGDIFKIGQTLIEMRRKGMDEQFDQYETENRIQKAISSEDPGLVKWLEGLTKDIVTEYGVWNGKDIFDARGNRRSWKSIHETPTLENIVKAMKKTQRQNGEGTFHRNEFGVAVKKFRSTKDMIANENLLKSLTHEEEKAIKDALSERMLKLVSEYMKTNEHPDDNQFIEHDRALDMMFDAWESARGNMAELKKQLNGWGYSADEALAKKIMSVFDDMSVMTTNYFEAKPQRPVRFNEMKAWIVPDTITPEDSRILAGNGQRVFTYRAGDEADRLRVVNAAAEATNAKFSVGRGGSMTGAGRDGEMKETVFNRPRASSEGSSDGVPDSQSDASPLRLRRKSGGTRIIVPNDGKKVKAHIRDFNNQDFSINVERDRPIGAIMKSLCKTLELRQKGSYNSHYGIFDTPAGKVAFRLSTHKAVGDNFSQDGAKRNTSVVIETYDIGNGETTVPYEEFVYPKDVFDANRKEIVAAIMNGVDTMIDTGRFVDSTGLATYTENKGTNFKRWFADSKIVDAEGKPLVVYRGASYDPLSQPIGKGIIKPESYFTADPEYANKYGKVNAYYLKIRKPFDVRNTQDAQRLSEFYPQGYKFATGKNGALDWAELGNFDIDELRAKYPEYDGIVLDEGADHGLDGKIKQRGVSYVPLNGGTQVKSATDNIGTFDPANPDIRMSAGRDGGIDPSVFVFDPTAKIVAMGETEQNAGGLAAGIEKKEALRPWTKKMSPADLAKPIAFDAADMVMFWRAVSGSVRNPHVQKGERIAGRKNAIGLNVGGDRIEIVSKLFGVMDASDIERLRNDCKADGFFRNEDADWCAGRSKGAVASETERSKAELDRRTRELYRTRVATGEGGMHYATQVLGHEIGHTLAKLPSDAKLGPVGDAMKTLYDSLVRELRRKADPLRPKSDTTVNDEIKQLIAWWHGQEEMPKYYEKPEERFAELFGIFLTQPESVQSLAPKAYDTCVKLIAENERLTGAYRKIVGLKWSGGSNDAVMRRVSATWDREAQEQYRKLTELTRQSVSLKRDWFNYALNDRFGPMFGLSERSVKAEKARLDKAVKDGAMSEQEAADRLKALTDEIDALRTSLYNWQRQSGGATRLMIAGFDDVKRQAEKDGVNWDDVRNYAHYMRVIELGGRATAHGVDPARAAAILDEMSAKLGTEKWTQVEKTWKAYRAVYERFVLEDPNVREIFDEATNKMLWENKHYVTMKHRMGVEESAEWKAKIEAYRKENGNAWDPCIDIQQRMHKGIGNAAEGGQGFVLHHLVGSFEATEDPIAATMKRAIEIKESAARNHLLKQTSETLRACGVKGVYDTAGGNGHAVDPGVYGKLTYMLDGVKHELIVPKVIERSYKADTTLSLGGFADAMRFIRNTMTLWNPAFINRAYLIDKSSLETNIKGLHKPLVDIVSEALCFRGVGVPLYMANNYLTRFTPIAKTWVGKILWNENTVNHYAYRAQKIARMIYEGKFGERLEEARQLRSAGETALAAEIEENVAVAREMLKRNVFQSQYEFNAEQRVGLNTDDILRTYGYRIEGGKIRKAGQRWNRFEEEQEACTKIIAYLYRMKQDAAEGKTSEADAAARARLVVEQGGTPNLAARGVMASYIENATGFFWNVRKEGALRSLRALKDHPTEWITKNLAQTATPAVLKALMLTGGLSLLVRKLFDDDEEKIAQSWWAPAVLEHAEFVREAMKCVPGYYQRNYNVIPLAKFGNEVVSMRVKYSPEEFALQNAIHNAFQRLGADPTDPSSDWSTLTEGMWNEFMPNIFGRNYALDAVGTLVGPLVGINPYDQYRQRNVYDKTTWEAKWNAPGNMLKEMGKNFWNYSPLGTFTTTFKNGQERKLEESDVPTWLDMVLQTPLVRMIPASMLAVTSSDSYTKALKEVDEGQKAYARIVARDILADCIGRGSLGGFAEGLKELKPELRTIAIRHVINGWREYHADPRAKVLKGARAIKDPMLKKKALDWIEKGMKYGD